MLFSSAPAFPAIKAGNVLSSAFFRMPGSQQVYYLVAINGVRQQFEVTVDGKVRVPRIGLLKHQEIIEPLHPDDLGIREVKWA